MEITPRTSIDAHYTLSSDDGVYGGIPFTHIETEPFDVRFDLSYYEFPDDLDVGEFRNHYNVGSFLPALGMRSPEAVEIYIYAWGSAWDPATVTIWTGSYMNTGPIGSGNPMPQITVHCTPTTVTRGESVTCVSSISDRDKTTGDVK